MPNTKDQAVEALTSKTKKRHLVWTHESAFEFSFFGYHKVIQIDREKTCREIHLQLSITINTYFCGVTTVSDGKLHL